MKDHSRGTSPWKMRVVLVSREILLIWVLLRDSKAPWHARLIAATVTAYLVSPIQLIPSFVPVIGMWDDIAAVTLGLWLIRRLAPQAVLRDAREHALDTISRNETALSNIVRTITILVAACWVTVTISCFLLLFHHVSLR
ncbi:MAG TPA: DUF1232 domain-containing protein [Candidatus Angelobacter sp.]|nr:DUF1232 domain-containing protein [Candidatus Angelobacter sp.]